MNKENSIQPDCMDYLRGSQKKGIKGIGGWWLNFHGGDPFMPRGIPDIIGCYKGRFVAIELKRPGEKPSAIQGKVLRMLKIAGALTTVAYSVEDVKTFLKLKGVENND